MNSGKEKMTDNEANDVDDETDHIFVKRSSTGEKKQIENEKLACQRCKNNYSDYLVVQKLEERDSKSNKLFSFTDSASSYNLADINFQLLCGICYQATSDEMKRVRKTTREGGSLEKQIRYSLVTPRINLEKEKHMAEEIGNDEDHKNRDSAEQSTVQ